MGEQDRGGHETTRVASVSAEMESNTAPAVGSARVVYGEATTVVFNLVLLFHRRNLMTRSARCRYQETRDS